MDSHADFAVTSCLHPAGPKTLSTQNLANYETLKLTFHDTANRCHQKGIRPTPVVFDGHARGSWISQRLNTTSLRTRRDTNLELAQRISSSLHRDSAREISRRVRLAASRDASQLLGADDWWPAWDDQLRHMVNRL